MSTVSFSTSQTLSSSENECDEKGYGDDSAGYEYLGNMDPAISGTSWTDEKHSLYLNLIEEAFVKSQYERGRFIHSCKRWESESITTSVSRKGLYEDIEPGINSCDYLPFNLFPEKGTKVQMLCKDEENQNRTKRSRLESTKRSRLERICIKHGLRHGEDINGIRANNCKAVKKATREGTTETGDHVQKESSPKTQMQCFEDTSKHDRGRNKQISERYMQEDQVVPSMENTS